MAKQQPQPVEDEPDAGRLTGAKLYKDNVNDLKALAALMNVTMAEAYRATCARVVSGALAAAARQRATEAEKDAKRG